jgi:hypothetical protein
MSQIMNGNLVPPPRKDLTIVEFLSNHLGLLDKKATYVSQIWGKSIELLQLLSRTPLFKQGGAWSIATASLFREQIRILLNLSFFEPTSIRNCIFFTKNCCDLYSTAVYTIFPLLSLVGRGVEIGKSNLPTAHIATAVAEIFDIALHTEKVWNIDSQRKLEMNPEKKRGYALYRNAYLIMISKAVCTIAALALRIGLGAAVVPNAAAVAISLSAASALLLVGSYYLRSKGYKALDNSIPHVISERNKPLRPIYLGPIRI